MRMMVALKMKFEMAKLMQEYESVQLAIAHALGGTVEDTGSNNGRRSSSIVKGTEIRNMEQMMSMFHTIGGKIGN